MGEALILTNHFSLSFEISCSQFQGWLASSKVIWKIVNFVIELPIARIVTSSIRPINVRIRTIVPFSITDSNVSIRPIPIAVKSRMNVSIAIILREFSGVKNVVNVVIHISSNPVLVVVIVSFVQTSLRNNTASEISNSRRKNI